MNHHKAGTYIPTKSELSKLSVIRHTLSDNYIHFYKNYKGGTMFLNVLYYLLMTYKNFELVVIGCDMIYKKNGDTFYSNSQESKARNDPLIAFGEQGLNEELHNSLMNYNKHNIKISNASINDTRLPYPRFTKYI